MTWLVLLALGVLAGTVGGVVGFGGSTILLPALVLVFGPKEAVPIMGLAGLLANLSRVTTWWRAVDWQAAAVYSLTGVPSVALGARLFLALDARMVEGFLGVFMIAMVPVRRWLMARQFDFDGALLARAVTSTFKNRKTAIDPAPVALTPAFTESPTTAAQWRAFVRRGKFAHVPEPRRFRGQRGRQGPGAVQV